MAFAINYSRGVAALLAIVSTGALYWYGNGLNPWWPLSLVRTAAGAAFCLAQFLVARRSRSGPRLIYRRQPQHVAFTFTRYYLRGVSVGDDLLFAALVFAERRAAFPRAAQRGAPWSALLALPSTWVSGEYLRNLTWPHGTAGNLLLIRS